MNNDNTSPPNIETRNSINKQKPIYRIPSRENKKIKRIKDLQIEYNGTNSNRLKLKDPVNTFLISNS